MKTKPLYLTLCALLCYLQCNTNFNSNCNNLLGTCSDVNKYQRCASDGCKPGTKYEGTNQICKTVSGEHVSTAAAVLHTDTVRAGEVPPVPRRRPSCGSCGCPPGAPSLLAAAAVARGRARRHCGV